jgi:hypothetical protein
MVRASAEASPDLESFEGFDCRWKVFSETGSELVGELLPVPHGVLAATSEHCDRLDQLAI